MCAADKDLGALGRISDLNNIDLDAVALLEGLGLYSLVGGKHGLGILAVGADSDRNASRPRLNAGYDAGEYLMLLRGEFLVDDASLSLADTLNDDLLCSLSGNAAEFLGLNGNLYSVADFGTLGDLLCGLNIDLKRRVLDLLDSDLVDVHLDALSALIQQYFNIICALGVITAKSSLHSLLYFIVHIILGYSLFFFKILNCGKEFCIHFNIPLFLYMLTCSFTCAICSFFRSTDETVTLPSS